MTKQEAEIAQSYAKVYSKRMPRDKKPSLVFNFKLTPKPEPTYDFFTGMTFIKDAKLQLSSQRVIVLGEKLDTWQDNRWEDTEGASWTENYLREMFKSGEYKYLGEIRL